MASEQLSPSARERVRRLAANLRAVTKPVKLGRALTAAEAREVRDTVRRIAALILLQPELDASYAGVMANSYAWPAA